MIYILYYNTLSLAAARIFNTNNTLITVSFRAPPSTILLAIYIFIFYHKYILRKYVLESCLIH